jgi:hypothetical protein
MVRKQVCGGLTGNAKRYIRTERLLSGSVAWDEALDDALAQTFPASDPIALLISP